MESKTGVKEDLFAAGPLSSLIPDDHILERVARVLDLSWLHDAVSASNSQDNGRPSIDPESALRLTLAGFFEGIVQDRKLKRCGQALVNDGRRLSGRNVRRANENIERN